MYMFFGPFCIVVLCVFLFGYGLHAGSTVDAKSCDVYGKFEHKEIVYVCSREAIKVKVM